MICFQIQSNILHTMLLHNCWWSNLSKRCDLVRRNCHKLWRIWELIWGYHHELLGLIMSWWINNSSRVILVATTNNPTRHCRGGNGNSSLDQGNKYLKSIASFCWFCWFQIIIWYTAVTFIVITASWNMSWIGIGAMIVLLSCFILIVLMIVPSGSGSGSGNVFTNIFMQIPTFFRQTNCSKRYQWKTNDSRNDTQCQEGTQAIINDKIMFIDFKIQK